MQQPSVGRNVHYVSYGTPGGEFPSVCRAAIVTEVDEQAHAATGNWVVGLAVLSPSGAFFDREVPYQDGDHRAGGTWHWPERV